MRTLIFKYNKIPLFPLFENIIGSLIIIPCLVYFWHHPFIYKVFIIGQLSINAVIIPIVLYCQCHCLLKKEIANSIYRINQSDRKKVKNLSVNKIICFNFKWFSQIKHYLRISSKFKTVSLIEWFFLSLIYFIYYNIDFLQNVCRTIFSNKNSVYRTCVDSLVVFYTAISFCCFYFSKGNFILSSNAIYKFAISYLVWRLVAVMISKFQIISEIGFNITKQNVSSFNRIVILTMFNIFEITCIYSFFYLHYGISTDKVNAFKTVMSVFTTNYFPVNAKCDWQSYLKLKSGGAPAEALKGALQRLVAQYQDTGIDISQATVELQGLLGR